MREIKCRNSSRMDAGNLSLAGRGMFKKITVDWSPHCQDSSEEMELAEQQDMMVNKTNNRSHWRTILLLCNTHVSDAVRFESADSCSCWHVWREYKMTNMTWNNCLFVHQESDSCPRPRPTVGIGLKVCSNYCIFNRPLSRTGWVSTSPLMLKFLLFVSIEWWWRYSKT